MMNKKKRKFKSNAELNFKNLFTRCILFSIIYFIVGLIFLLVLSWVFYNSDDPTSKIELVGLISLYSAGLITSFVQSKVNGQYYFLSGLILGLLILSVSLILSLIFPIDNAFSAINLIWRGLIPVICVLGGVLGAKNRNSKRKHHRKI